MTHLWPTRPASALARPNAPTPVVPPSTEAPPSPWLGLATSWLRSASESVVDRLAGVAASAKEPEEVRVELVRLAWEISGASKVELFCDRAARRLACWPPVVPHETTPEGRSRPRGPVVLAIKAAPGPSTLQLPLKAGDDSFGSLRLTAKGRRPWSSRVVRRLTTLCAIASAAERGLARPLRGLAEPDGDPTRGPHGSTILAAFLNFGLAQARRRHEPLSLLEVAVDRLDTIRELLGEELAEAAVERVARAIKSTVRASDVVARLEQGRLAILMPNASPENAMKIAESVRTAIARAGAASTTMPTLTASIGTATYPDHAHDVASLRAAAASTLTKARELGPDRIATAPPIPSPTSPSLAHRVG